MDELTDTTYEEVLSFRVFNPNTPSSHRGLVPSELDIAILNSQIAMQQSELQRLDKQSFIPEMTRIMEKPDPTEEEKQKLSAYRLRRTLEMEAFNTALYRTRANLEKACGYLDDPDPRAQDVEDVYQLRDFFYEERLDAEDRFSTLNPLSQEREVNIERRNFALLQLCLQGKRVADGLQTVDARRLPSKVVQTLIDRQWARSEMSVALAGHFRSRGGVPGQSPDGTGVPG